MVALTSSVLAAATRVIDALERMPNSDTMDVKFASPPVLVVRERAVGTFTRNVDGEWEFEPLEEIK